MNYVVVATFASHLGLATVLLVGVNWIGKHAVEFGYASTTLFEDVSENLALNFFLRAMSPAVFIIAVSAFVVAIGRSEWRLGIHWVVVYYYFLRGGVIVLLNRQRLASWPRFVLHSAAGIGLALLAYHYLIIPNRSLLPQVEDLGNELWLAILAFLYAVANKVPVAGGPGARRRNDFVSVHYQRARGLFGHIVESPARDEQLVLIIYAVIVYEDYARPWAIRWVERLMFWKKDRTTGIMQVASARALSDEESVVEGSAILSAAWNAHASEAYPYHRALSTVKEYNGDDDYASRVLDVMELLAKRADTRFLPAYNGLWEQVASRVATE